MISRISSFNLYPIASVSTSDTEERLKNITSQCLGQKSSNVPKKIFFNCTERCKFEDPYHKHGHWSTDEDDLLKALVQKYGEDNWKQVSLETHRSEIQCRQRWRDYLDPRFSKKIFSDDDLEKLLKIIPKYFNAEKNRISWNLVEFEFNSLPNVLPRNKKALCYEYEKYKSSFINIKRKHDSLSLMNDSSPASSSSSSSSSVSQLSFSTSSSSSSSSVSSIDAFFSKEYFSTSKNDTIILSESSDRENFFSIDNSPLPPLNLPTIPEITQDLSLPNQSELYLTWSSEEDEQLKKAVEEQLEKASELQFVCKKINWKKVSLSIPSRSAKGCKSRWAVLKSRKRQETSYKSPGNVLRTKKRPRFSISIEENKKLFKEIQQIAMTIVLKNREPFNKVPWSKLVSVYNERHQDISYTRDELREKFRRHSKQLIRESFATYQKLCKGNDVDNNTGADRSLQ